MLPWCAHARLCPRGTEGVRALGSGAWGQECAEKSPWARGRAGEGRPGLLQTRLLVVPSEPGQAWLSTRTASCRRSGRPPSAAAHVCFGVTEFAGQGGSPMDVMHAQSLSRVQVFATPRTAAHEAPLSMAFPRQEYWSGLPFPSPWNLPTQRLSPRLLQVDSYH